jgi:polyphosphate kinase 2 (PPK2 family)
MAAKKAELIAELIKPLRVKPGSKVNLAKDFDPGYKAGYVKKKDARRILGNGIAMLCDYQSRLAAQDRYAVLMCLQALDAGGKDGTIRHVMSGVNPQGVHVTSFKQPSAEELDHDYLWRYARHLPARGDIGSSTGRITKRYSWCACIRKTWTGRSYRTTPKTSGYGGAGTARSTTGNAT